MKITLVESSLGNGRPQQLLASYLINDSVCIDAGSIGFFSPLAVQKQVRHIFLSHSHIDHVASLPIFVDNTYEHGPDCVTVHAGRDVQQCLQSDVFNDRLWPDMVRLSGEETPFLKFADLVDRQPVVLDGLTVTPVALNHVVPTLGFLIDDGSAAVAIVSDTGPTEAIWEVLQAVPHLKAVFLEASFPDRMEWLAEKAMHLTPALFAAERSKLGRDVPFYAVHIKIAFEEEVRAELAALAAPPVEISQPGRCYEF